MRSKVIRLFLEGFWFSQAFMFLVLMVGFFNQTDQGFTVLTNRDALGMMMAFILVNNVAAMFYVFLKFEKLLPPSPEMISLLRKLRQTLSKKQANDR